MNVWRSYLDIDPAETHDEAVNVSAMVIREIKSLEATLKRLKVNENAYKPAFDQLKKAWSPTQLSDNWSKYSDTFGNLGLISVLHWSSWAVKEKSENPVSEEIFEKLLDKLEEQEELLNTKDMPASIYEMLHRHVEELRQAIRYYKITGIQPVVDTVRKQVGEMATTSTDVVELSEASPEAKKAMQKGFEVIAEAAKVAENGSKLFKFAGEVRRLGGDVVDTITGLIQNIPSPPAS